VAQQAVRIKADELSAAGERRGGPAGLLSVVVMEFAYSDARIRTAATAGARGTCPLCAGLTIAKCGELVVHHWAHESRRDCDSWSEGETAWHRNWKAKFPAAWREVTMGPHRADVRTKSGLVVELQHSAISPEEIRERESFYGWMVWIIDAAAFKRRLEFSARCLCGHAVIAGRSEFGGWTCWRKQGGCGRQFSTESLPDLGFEWHRPAVVLAVRQLSGVP
jgi:hypothetical protein